MLIPTVNTLGYKTLNKSKHADLVNLSPLLRAQKSRQLHQSGV